MRAKLKPLKTGGMYGVLAFELSAFSEVLMKFQEGTGQIAIHGTNDAESIGRAISHGCIRMLNSDIVNFESFIGLGAPVEIRDGRKL